MKNRRKIWVPAPNEAVCITDKFDGSITSPAEVLVKTKYSHISAGTELACIAGKESFFTIPDTPGYTAVGVIEEAGAAVQHVKPGDWVFTYGPHAEYFKVDTTDRWHGVCIPLPEGVDPELAAFAHMGGIAMTALRNSRIELGDFVLVTGLGAIGNIVSQLAQLQGGRVIASDIVEQRVQLARDCGIRFPINPATNDLAVFIEKTTGSRGVSTYIDATGSAAVVENSTRYVGLNGEVILLGSPRAAHQTNLTGFLQHYHNLPWNLTLKGALEFTLPTHQTDFVKHSIERNTRIVLELIRDGQLQVQPFYSHKIKPTDIQSAYDGLRYQPEDYIGVVIDWN